MRTEQGITQSGPLLISVVRDILDSAIANRKKLHLFYQGIWGGGDQDVAGYIQRRKNTGRFRSPDQAKSLNPFRPLISPAYNISFGGSVVLDQFIVSIRDRLGHSMYERMSE